MIEVEPVAGALGAEIRGGLVEFLFAHSARPDFTCRFRWRRHSVAFWDNRCALHFALNDYQGHRRVMQRVTIKGDRPV
ncbi:MAG TPA: TauD/TfdA family dioxygenase [Opitutaceae bacterium]